MAGVLPGSEVSHGERVEAPGQDGDADDARAARLGGEVGSGGAGAEAVQDGAGVRVRRVRQHSIPDQREPKPGRVSAYEQSLKNYTEKKSNVVIDPAVGTSFDSCGEAFDFYNLYSWEMGFGIRWGGSAKDPSKNIIMEQIVRCCQGEPDGNAVLLSTDCKAMIRLHRSDDNGWYIKEFQDNSVDLSKSLCVIASYFEVMKNLVFDKTSLKALSRTIIIEDFGDDVAKTLELFDDFGSLRRDDPRFMYLVELGDSNDRFKTLLWTNGRSRMQYAYFGDAITFDTTYKTNLDDMRFGLFVGANNHYETVILGGVLMRHESVESFKWVFHEFVTLMGGKAPSSILTGPEIIEPSADCGSEVKSRIMSKGVPVEEHAVKIYTRAMFGKFNEAIFQSGSYVVDEKEKGKVYSTWHIRSDRCEMWSQVEFEVTIRAEDGAVVCECGLGEHMGMPCCHVVKVMTHFGMKEIPAGNIVKHWTTNARDVLPAHLIEYDMDRAAQTSQAIRLALVYIAALEITKLASPSAEAFELAVSHLNLLHKEIVEHRQVMDDFGMSEQFSQSTSQSSDVQEVSAATTDDATSARRKRSMKTKAPDHKSKILQHAQAEGPQ
ncbi:hypothetical protein QOZ80_7AG0558080 [Eleusine coracana subsp. coracana]|nr:hypothetical protein QOZ80_7AG0558080 [Eleusine coracana subsp. coracana]